MKTFTHLFLTFVLGICFFLQASLADVRLPSIFSSHMVLQQKSEVKIWGWANPRENVKVVASWAEKDTVSVETSGYAKWTLNIHTPQAGGPYILYIMGQNTITLEDVMVGEVWVASGQSNMQWSVNNKIDQGEEEVANANWPDIRFFHVPKSTAETPQENIEGTWVRCTPESMRSFSAVAYFYGRKLHQELKVPVGLVHASWGGTPAEVWMEAEEVNEDPDLRLAAETRKESKGWPALPGVAYHAMIAPITDFRIAGVIWYQGESNTHDAIGYRKLFPKLIQNWRELWSLDLPFYFVQIAPFKYGDDNVNGALVRESQLLSFRNTKKTGIVVVSDIGNTENIHPTNKQDVGARLGNWALANTYGKQGVSYSGPLYREMKVEKNKIRVSFDFAENGLLVKGKTLTHFEIAGEDRKFYPARAKIEGSTIVVSAKAVKNPLAVRMGFYNTAEPNLFNQEGLPASSFRTDDWEIK
ncbi:MAG: sialate O-acetylesterase [Cyclobacteriaceae bacterium]|nr:sialate O-acetylesterase [Cyclobacteriaceae bacterium]